MKDLCALRLATAMAVLLSVAVSGCKLNYSTLSDDAPAPAASAAPAAAAPAARCQAFVPPSLTAVHAAAQDAFSNIVLRKAADAETCELPGGDALSLLKGMETMLTAARCTASRIFVAEDIPYTNTPSARGSRSVDIWKCPDRVTPDVATQINRMPRSSAVDGLVAITMLSGPDQNFEIIAWDRLHQTHLFWAAAQGPAGENFVFDGSSFQMATEAETNGLNYPPSHPCTNCHANGALLMKELTFPWTNWFPGQVGADGALAALKQTYSFPGLATRADLQAQQLEAIVRASKASIGNERARRLKLAVASGGLGGTLRDAMRPLLCDTEIQLGSAASALPNAGQVTLPADLVVASDLVNALQVDVTTPIGADATQWRTFFTDGSLSVGATAGTPAASTTPFGASPYLMPVRAQADIALATALQRQGVLEAKLAIAARMVDFPNGVFSAKRCGLLSVVPDTALGTLSAADVTAAVSAAMTTAGGQGNTAASDFATFLGANAGDLKTRVQTYYAKCVDSNNASRVTGTAASLYGLIWARSWIIAGRTPDLPFVVQRLEGFNTRMFPENGKLAQRTLTGMDVGLGEDTCGVPPPVQADQPAPSAE